MLTIHYEQGELLVQGAWLYSTEFDVLVLLLDYQHD